MNPKIKTTRSTWLGRAGISTVYSFDSSQLGKRIDVMVWLDDPGIAHIHALKGSFWRGPKGYTYEETTISNDAESITAEVSRLAAKHFGKAA